MSDSEHEPDADEERRSNGDLPAEVVDEAERLTRLAREVVDEDEAEAYRTRRDDALERRAFTSRVREDDDGDVLVLHPEEWHEDGTIRTDRIEDTSRAVEIPLEGTGDPDDWDELEARNRALADAVRERHGDVHGDNADVLADFAGNHYAKPIESMTPEEREEFLEEYFVRNAWPSEEQRAAIEESIELVLETADESGPV